jgi:hypothetical protein
VGKKLRHPLATREAQPCSLEHERSLLELLRLAERLAHHEVVIFGGAVASEKGPTELPGLLKEREVNEVEELTTSKLPLPRPPTLASREDLHGFPRALELPMALRTKQNRICRGLERLLRSVERFRWWRRSRQGRRALARG